MEVTKTKWIVYESEIGPYPYLNQLEGFDSEEQAFAHAKKSRKWCTMKVIKRTMTVVDEEVQTFSCKPPKPKFSHGVTVAPTGFSKKGRISYMVVKSSKWNQSRGVWEYDVDWVGLNDPKKASYSGWPEYELQKFTPKT